MKKKTIGCLAAFAGGLLFYAGWVSYPPARYSQQTEEILARCSQKDEEQRSKAVNVEQNGYLNPTLLPMWGRKDIEGQEGSAPYKVVAALDPYSDLRAGKETHLELALAKKDPAAEKAYTDFVPIYTEFRKSAHQPLFLVPYDKPLSFSTLIPNFIAFRSLAQASAGYAEYLVLKGKPSEALQAAGDIIAFGWQIDQGQGSLISRMISIAIQSIGQETAAMALQSPSARFESQSLKTFRDLLERTQCPMSEIVDAFEIEYYCANNTFSVGGFEEELGEGAAQTVLLSLPGFVAREQRLYQNDYYPFLNALRTGKTPDVSFANDISFGTWFTGKHGFISAILIPNYTRAIGQQHLSIERQGFLHLYVWCLLETGPNGTPPENLAALQAKGYKPLTEFDAEKVQWKKSGDSLELSLDHPDNDLLLEKPAEPDMEEWNALAVRRWVLTIKPKVKS